jgi:AcrR family transcriptional regulator
LRGCDLFKHELLAASTQRSVEDYKHGRVPRAVRRVQLLELAEPLFIEKGYGGFSIDGLCRAAGVTRPVVYNHFGSKDGIYIACLCRIREELENALLAAAAGAPDLTTAVERSVEAWFSMIERDPQRWSLVYGGADGPVGPLADRLADLRDTTAQQIATVLARHAPHASSEQVTLWARSVSGAGEQLGRWWLGNPDIPRSRVVAFFSNFLLASANHLITRGGELPEENLWSSTRDLALGAVRCRPA